MILLLFVVYVWKDKQTTKFKVADNEVLASDF